MWGVSPAIDRNSDGWQKCFTNVPPSASRVSADHNVKNVFSGICDAEGGATPRIVDCCQCCQCCQFQFSISNIGIDNWQHSHTGNIQQDKVENT